MCVRVCECVCVEQTNRNQKFSDTKIIKSQNRLRKLYYFEMHTTVKCFFTQF